jgi:adenine-specific DNA-methyltransferase
MISGEALATGVEKARAAATEALDPERRSLLGQFMTPQPIAEFMASMFRLPKKHLRLLEAGAGVGSLVAALVRDCCERSNGPKRIDVVTYELDPLLLTHLGHTLESCKALCKRSGIDFTYEIRDQDFVIGGSDLVADLFARTSEQFDAAILNPPYKKILSSSPQRLALRPAGIETSNLYTAFLSLAVKLLAPSGEMVAITPRSFCNGPYFRPFRELLLEATAFRRVHVFESRNRAFEDVLQENIIFHVEKGAEQGPVDVSWSDGPASTAIHHRTLEFSQLVDPLDAQKFIHIVPHESGDETARVVRSLRGTLSSIGVAVSTGRVVDFRSRVDLRAEFEKDCVPLVYPGHFQAGYVHWPRTNFRKPNALLSRPETQWMIQPSGIYVLVKRFSSKEEPRRVVATIFDPDRVPHRQVAFENHVNVFHVDGAGLPSMDFARGLAAYLNSTVVDDFFRLFNGHTQVNATDLRNLPYPTRAELLAIGKKVGDTVPDQVRIDQLATSLWC